MCERVSQERRIIQSLGSPGREAVLPNLLALVEGKCPIGPF